MMQRLLRHLKSVFHNSEPECKHRTDTIRANDDEHIWYRISKETGREYWSETDAAYVKLQRTEKHFLCLGCGHETTITSADRIGGPNGVKQKSEMSPSELSEFRANVHGGAFFNGLPDHRKLTAAQECPSTSTSNRGDLG